MEILRELIQIHGACATRAMLDEAIKQEHIALQARLQDITLYMSETPQEQAVLQVIESKISSVEEQLSKSAKAEQRAAESAKRAQLSTAGINPRDQLTKENLERWLREGKSFSQIAREEVGLRQEEVSAAAKKYGLKAQKKIPQTLHVNKEPAE